jgi:DNA-binding transcriptional MerR regulator
MQGPKIRRLYYSARDVSEIVNISSQLLREWEESLPNLKPSKSKSGRRLYKPEDMKKILRIKEWKENGYSNKEINRLLRGDDDREKQIKKAVSEKKATEKCFPFYEIYNGLLEILHILD